MLAAGFGEFIVRNESVSLLRFRDHESRPRSIVRFFHAECRTWGRGGKEWCEIHVPCLLGSGLQSTVISGLYLCRIEGGRVRFSPRFPIWRTM